MTIRVLALTTLNPDQTEALSTYMATTSPLLEQAKARVVQTYNTQSTLIGETVPNTVTIVEYPDMDAVNFVFQSAEYGLLKEIRAQAFSNYQIAILED